MFGQDIEEKKYLDYPSQRSANRKDISDALHTDRVAVVRPPVGVHAFEGDREGSSIFLRLRPFGGSAGGKLCRRGAGRGVARHLVVARELLHQMLTVAHVVHLRVDAGVVEEGNGNAVIRTLVDHAMNLRNVASSGPLGHHVTDVDDQTSFLRRDRPPLLRVRILHLQGAVSTEVLIQDGEPPEISMSWHH